MKRRIAFLAAVLALLAADAQAAQEANWFGKFDLVESTAGRSTRFFARGAGLSLFARGDAKAILLAGFYAKATMSVGYRPIPCPSAIKGPCGRVNFVSVDRGGNF